MRLVRRLARRADLLLGLSIAMLVAAVIGVQLGRSAIGEINPVHFRGALAAPRGIDPNASRPAPDAFASAYGWDEGHRARAADCGGDCDARQVREAMVYAMETPRTLRAGGPYWRDDTPVAEPAPWAPGETGGRRLSVERYMHYPIETGDEPAEATKAEPEPAE